MNGGPRRLPAMRMPTRPYARALLLAGACLTLLGATASEARADWYFQWLSGGYVGPFATYDDCQARRYLDDAHIHSNLCMEYDAPPGDTGSRPPLPTQRLSIGTMIGPGWGIRDVEVDSNGGVTTGFHFNWRISRNPSFSISTSVGLQLTRIEAEALGPDAMVPLIVPITVGLAVTPGNDQIRLDVGAGGGMHFGLSCPVPDRSCGGFYGELHAEVDMYPTRGRNGVSAGVIVLGSEGGGLTAPLALVRLQFLRRNLDL
jgi:hypothetical protein